MKLDFDLEEVRVIEFVVGHDEDGEIAYFAVPVDGEVQDALRDMVTATGDAMGRHRDRPATYCPSEKHSATDHLVLSLGDDLAQQMKRLHAAENLPIDAGALKEPDTVICYVARLTDANGRRLTALRRATQFKGILRSRLLRFDTDALKLVDDSIFRLDTDFDLLIDSKHVHILRPAAFEFVGRLREAVLAAAPQNVRQLESALKHVDFSGVESYAMKHPRAARYLASIRALGEAGGISKAALRRQCRRTGVAFTEANGKLVIAEGDVMGFLEVLDRRRYGIELVPGSPETYRAGSREKIVRE